MVRRTLLCLLAVLAAAPAAAHADRPGATRLADRILDPTSRGNVTFEGTANVASYQQDGLLTHRGYQYTAWYKGDRTAVISRRKLPDGAWRSLELDVFLWADDSHNNIAMAVSPSDGRLHLTYATHADGIRYQRSVPGLASDPEGVAWSSRSFEPLQALLPGAPQAPTIWTYPVFETHGGKLLLTYRDGNTENGRQLLLRYDDNAAGTWTMLGRFTSSTGTYRSPFGQPSTSRYSYFHGFQSNPVTGDLEVSWTWREQSRSWCSPRGLGNHDLGYARSSDGGLTWQNNAGATIGRTGSADLISIEDDHVVVPIPINQGMINQESQAFDSLGRVHVMTSQFSDADLASIGGCHTSTYSQRKALARPVHHWRDQAGTWRSTELPFYNRSAGRTKLIFDKHDAAYLVLPDGRIAVAMPDEQWSKWRIVFDAEDVDSISELIVDRQRLKHDGVLSVAYQETGVPRGANSAFRVADFHIRRGRAPEPAAKATTPEAAPEPFSGDAPVFPRASSSSKQLNYPPQFAVDGSRSTFWVSSGTSPGDGPTPLRPETLTMELGEARTIDRVVVTPRVGYGPRTFTIEGRVKGAWRALAAVAHQANAGATHAVPVTTVDAVRLVITASYDSRTPTRNVQVAELAVGAAQP